MFVADPISYVVVDSAPVGNAWILDVGFVIPERLSLLYVSKSMYFTPKPTDEYIATTPLLPSPPKKSHHHPYPLPPLPLPFVLLP